MKHTIIAFLAGSLFAIGLTSSGMTRPEIVQGFLDFFGNWDPRMLFTIAGAVLVYALIFRISKTFTKPIFSDQFMVPTSRIIDRKLIIGSSLFGFGWGLSGYCPAPAIVSGGGGVLPVFVFLLAMLLGMWVFSITDRMFKNSQ
ncbi:MAG: YeeE/YedE family protein [Desulfofustis sp.]|jgi:hypothetical protein|nr:YeeE/YedE family protein [Desulfofustis sp.]